VIDFSGNASSNGVVLGIARSYSVGTLSSQKAHSTLRYVGLVHGLVHSCTYEKPGDYMYLCPTLIGIISSHFRYPLSDFFSKLVQLSRRASRYFLRISAIRSRVAAAASWALERGFSEASSDLAAEASAGVAGEDDSRIGSAAIGAGT
jgi:hypothetical protein